MRASTIPSNPRGYATAVAVAALIVAAGIPLIGPSTVGEGAETPETNFTALNWSAPENFTGNIAVHVQLRPSDRSEAAWCEWYQFGEGRVEDDWPPLIHWFWRENRGDPWLNRQEAVRAHAAGQLDTRRVIGQATDGTWYHIQKGGRRIHNWTLDLVYVDFNVEKVEVERTGLDDGETPWRINISCSNPVEVNLSAGRAPVPLTHTSMTDGGVGASTRIPRVSVQWNARKASSFNATKVLFQATWEPGDESSDMDETLDQEGRLSLDHPNGTIGWDLGSLPGPEEETHMSFSGGPGGYTANLELMRTDLEADHDSRHVLGGVLAGLDPVDSLDEIV